MVEVTIDSIRVSLISQHRVIVLKEVGAERYLPIWIGPFEADAIAIHLQGVHVARPLTHDLLKSVIQGLGARISYVVVDDLRNDTFYARIILDVDGHKVEIDSRPSDAIALAVRAEVPIYVEDKVMEQAAITPEEGIPVSEEEEEVKEEELSPFKEFLDSLDLSDLEDLEEMD
ncbi:MAG: bifunctional nuclease family protein [Chloroflexi bacterium]|nr:MAG: bifunctional nuclease family protein [Chloroflexota bacterium]HDN80618.1 bifunctional nuclease family protein [Chloroflexota bacterium]